MIQRLMPGIATSAHRALLIALLLSVALHLVASVGTPHWFSMWQQPETVQFQAVLTPLSTPQLIDNEIKANAVVATSRPKTVRRRTPRPLPTLPSEAKFVAPENAIAVARDNIGEDAAVGTAAENTAENVATVVAPAVDVSPLPAASEPPPVVAAIPAPPVPAGEPPVPVELPSRVSIAYRATTSIADGVAHYRWKRDGDKYEFTSTIQAEGFFVNMFAGNITQQSSGTVGAGGLEPALFSIRRGDRAAETAEFLRVSRQIKLTRGGESRQLPMPPDLQDTQSFLFQLAIKAAKLKTAEDRLDIDVTNARGLNRYTFKKAGEEALQTRLGIVETVHLVRETSEPRDSYEVWLSPKHHYLPVKLKFFVDRFPAELVATNITSAP